MKTTTEFDKQLKVLINGNISKEKEVEKVIVVKNDVSNQKQQERFIAQKETELILLWAYEQLGE